MTHHVVLKVVFTSKLKLRFSVGSVQGDLSACGESPVDFKTKVPFWPGQARPSQAKAELLF